MKIKTKTKKDHTLKMTDGELGVLVGMLDQWKKQYADQLPEGTVSAAEANVYRELYYVRHRRYPNEGFGGH